MALSNEKKTQNATKIEMSALGRPASLGDLYDIRAESFCTAWKGRGRLTLAAGGVLPLAISKPCPSVQVRHSFDDDEEDDCLSARFRALDVNDPQLRLSILGGLLRPEGVGRYLYHREGGRRAGGTEHGVTATLFCQARAVERKLDFSQQLAEEEVGETTSAAARTLMAVENDMEQATHFVSGIVLGATVAASITSRPMEAPLSQLHDGEKGGSHHLLAAKARLDGRLMALKSSLLPCAAGSDGERRSGPLEEEEVHSLSSLSLPPIPLSETSSCSRSRADMALFSKGVECGDGCPTLPDGRCSEPPPCGTSAASAGGPRHRSSIRNIRRRRSSSGSKMAPDVGCMVGEEDGRQDGGKDAISVRIFSDLIWEMGVGESPTSLVELKKVLDCVVNIGAQHVSLLTPVVIVLSPISDYLLWHRQLRSNPVARATALLRGWTSLAHPDEQSICETMTLFQDLQNLEEDFGALLHEIALAIRAHGETAVLKTEVELLQLERCQIEIAKQQLRQQLADATVRIRSSSSSPPAADTIPSKTSFDIRAFGGGSAALTRVVDDFRRNFRPCEARKGVARESARIKETAAALTYLRSGGVSFGTSAAGDDVRSVGAILSEHPRDLVYVLVHLRASGHGESWARNLALLKRLVVTEKSVPDSGGGAAAASVTPRCFFYFLEVLDSSSSPEDVVSFMTPRSSSSSCLLSLTRSDSTEASSVKDGTCSAAERLTPSLANSSFPPPTTRSAREEEKAMRGREEEGGMLRNGGAQRAPSKRRDGGGDVDDPDRRGAESDGPGVVAAAAIPDREGGDVGGTPDTSIRLYLNGCLLVEDVWERAERVARLCVVRSTEMEFDSRVATTGRCASNGPRRAAPLRIPCPGSVSGGQCASDVRDWYCERCAVQADYAGDGYVYCDCGRARFDSLGYLCRDPKHHGNRYMSYARPQQQRLARQLSSMPTTGREINILLLGESGVGKSTFINAFANYLRHEDMRGAREDLVALVPSSFTVCHVHDYKGVRVTVGERDANEEAGVGKSATQSCKGYVFSFGSSSPPRHDHERGDGELKVRLIDTPGIGDTRGIEQDRQNFDNVLRFLDHHQELHAICILLKPNNARKNVMFRFCVQEMLTHLHKSARNNLAFVFTNARSTFYQPGETMVVLREILDNVNLEVSAENVYCLDSESFRFLAALKHGVRFSDQEMHDFGRSWSVSVRECRRLMDFVLSRSPHRVQDTISLNEARRRVLQLAGPMGEITRLVQMANPQLVEEQKQRIEASVVKLAELTKKPLERVRQVKEVRLLEPACVCMSPKCTELITLDGTGKYHYKAVCHRDCRDSIGGLKVINDPGLRSCVAMGSDGKCKLCGCDWTSHMRVDTVTSLVTDYRREPGLANTIKSVEAAKSAAEKRLKELIAEAGKLHQELGALSATSTRFALYQQCHAIIPHNDALLEYLDHLIAEEKNSQSADCKAKLTRLLELKQEFENEERILSMAALEWPPSSPPPRPSSSSSPVERRRIHSPEHSTRRVDMLSLEESRRRMDELFGLEISGRMIRHSVQQSESRARTTQFRYCEALVRTSKETGWGLIKHHAPHFPNPPFRIRCNNPKPIAEDITEEEEEEEYSVAPSTGPRTHDDDDGGYTSSSSFGSGSPVVISMSCIRETSRQEFSTCKKKYVELRQRTGQRLDAVKKNVSASCGKPEPTSEEDDDAREDKQSPRTRGRVRTVHLVPRSGHLEEVEVDDRGYMSSSSFGSGSPVVISIACLRETSRQEFSTFKKKFAPVERTRRGFSAFRTYISECSPRRGLSAFRTYVSECSPHRGRLSAFRTYVSECSPFEAPKQYLGWAKKYCAKQYSICKAGSPRLPAFKKYVPNSCVWSPTKG